MAASAKQSSLVAAHVRRLEPYVPGEQPRSRGVVKLNTNENPYPPSPRCMDVLRTFAADSLRRYPDPVFSELRREIAAMQGARPECVFVGNGSDEILSLAARAFVDDGSTIGSLDPSYSLYKTLAAIRGVRWRGSASLAAAAKRDDALFLLTNPNAPTGAFREPDEIAAFAKGRRGVVLVDEAYADFARDNCMRLAVAPGNRNTIVMRTFSKSWSLAGLRVGYCIGPQALIEALYKIKDSYNVDAVAQAVALAALRDRDWMLANVAKVVKERGRLAARLAERGWDVPRSESNFLFARPPSIPAADVFAALRERGIFVRYFPGPKTGERLRITVGTPAQSRRLVDAIDEIFGRRASSQKQGGRA